MSPRDALPIYQGVISSLPELKQFMNWAHFDSDLNKACTIYAEFEAKSLRGEEINFAGFDLHKGKYLYYSCTSSKRVCQKVWTRKEDLLAPLMNI